MLNLYQITLPLTVITSLSLGLFVLWNNSKSHINIAWAMLSFSVATWALGMRIGSYANTEEEALVWWNVAEYGALLIPIFYAHFVNALVGRKGHKNPVVITGYVLAALFLFPSLALKTPESVSPKGSFAFYPNPSVLYNAFVFVFWIYVVYGHVVLIRELKHQTKPKQNQIKLVLLATILGFASGTPGFLIVYGIPFDPWTIHFVPIYTFVMTYAIVKHHLMDISVVIRKSVIYSILVVFITVTYLLSVLLSERLLRDMLGYRSLTPSLLTAFVIALGFIPIKNWIQSFVDRYFFRGTVAGLTAENERMKQELERSERLKTASVMATGLAHEIKNPLSAIRTFVSYLPERYQDQEFRDKFTRIVGNEVERINGIVQQLLNFAKPAPLEPKPTDVNQLLQDTVAFLNSECLKRRVEVATDLRANHAPLQADPNQLRQVFLNLLLNALEAMEQGGRLQIATRNQGGGVEITIRDCGKGIPPEAAHRVFEPFYTTKDTGVGLGLAIVRSIVERHGGRVTINSQPNAGTTVTLYLPFHLPTPAIT